VEAVAWITEGKDLFCAFFFLSGLFSYIIYVGGKRQKNILYIINITVVYFITIFQIRGSNVSGYFNTYLFTGCLKLDTG